MVKVKSSINKEVQIPIGEGVHLSGLLTVPEGAKSLILFAHGSGSSRHSLRNQLVAKYLQDEQMATLLFDLLTEEEEELDKRNYELRFNIPLLTERLIKATEWASSYELTSELLLGYFGASTGAAAALMAASELRERIYAVVSRGGRPDLAGSRLARVQAPTLLIVGGADFGVIELNEQSLELLSCTKKLEIVPRATHLFEESGAMEEVGRMAAQWFNEHL